MKRIWVFVSLLIFAVMCKAEVGVGLKAGTTGPGIELTFPLKEKLNLRTGIAYYSIDKKLDKADAKIQNAELNLLNIPLLLDWHPFGGGFRVSLGAFYADNYISAKAKDQTVTINNHDYSVSNLSGKIAFDNKICPYLGIGIGNAASKDQKRFHFSLDIGVFLSGSPDISLTATAQDPTLQSALDNDIQSQKKKFKDEAKDYKLYPVISLGISYTF